MWPTSTEAAAGPLPMLRACAVALCALALGACSGMAQRPDDAQAVAGPDPVAVAEFEQAVAVLVAGDEAAAEARFTTLAAAHPDYAGPLVNLAVIRARRAELEPAAALLERAVAVCTNCAPAWNELGVVQRRQGRFADAEQSYQRAIAAAEGYAPAWFNLGVLNELYLQRPAAALDCYQRFRTLQATDPLMKDVDKWIADLERRTGAVARSAQLEAAP